ncbi:NRPS-like enzyme [Aspergillus ustus]|uniref:NRPS-like enzyme n=1 Tax=Aspergillus ustus TaxID=40382 RepID=A0A0C1E208_ASPUT|nr:NRPS-like enzyme [Aspergillus ustus]
MCVINGSEDPRFTWPKLSLHAGGEGDARSLPELIDFHARVNPHHRFCVQAQKNDAETPLLDVTYTQLKHAILRCQSWLCENVAEIQGQVQNEETEMGNGTAKGKEDSRPVVGILMDSDLTLVIYLFALMGLGVPTVLLSTRLSAEAVRHLVAKTRTSALLVSPRLDGTADEAFSSWDEDSEDSPPPPSKYYPSPYKNFLSSEEEASAPPSLSQNNNNAISRKNHFISESDCNALILHSSGTTGLPKPIYTSHRHYLSFALCHEFKTEEEMLAPALSTSPLFHGFGLLPPSLSLSLGKPFILADSTTIFTAASTTTLLRTSGAKSLLTVPSLLEEIALLPENEGVRALQDLHFIAFGGGLPKESIGERLTAAGVKLLNHYGATETGPLAPLYVPGPEYDWHFFKLRGDIRDALRVRLEPSTSGDVDGEETGHWKLSLQPIGWTDRFPIQDILVARPGSVNNEYTVLGRSDDLIRLATGEKVRPTIVESLLAQSEAVKAAIAFGDGQFEIGVLVEPAVSISSPEEGDAFKRATLWPIIQQAGEKMDAHARISSPQAIILVPEGKSLPRSDKGTVLRREVNRVFESEIAEVYRSLDAVIDYSVPQLRIDSLEGDLRKLISDNLKWTNNGVDWTDERDFFELGMDSLQATILRRLLVSSLRDGLSKVSIGRDFVYQHPSIAKLAAAVREGCAGQDAESASAVDGSLLERFIETYSLQSNNNGEATVLLTGGTGSLGSHFLAHLVRSSTVRRVICLNRSSSSTAIKKDPHDRQAEALTSKGLTVTPEEWSKITVFETNTSSPKLGLSDADYTSLLGVTHIVHNAWPMNFKMHVSSYESQFRVLQNLLSLARDAYAHQNKHEQQATKPRKTRFLFISSISVVGRYGKLTGETIVPETPISIATGTGTHQDPQGSTLDLGYAQAKLVCEKIIERARADFGDQIEAGFVRVGQIAGAAHGGFWNADEHFASLVASSQTLGYLPDIRGTLSWLPVDQASAVLAELIFSTQPLDLVYHLENPVRQSWNEVLNILATELAVPKHDRRPMAEWVEEVRRRPQDDNNSNPAAAIADFFQENFEWMSGGSIVLSTETSRRHSPTLRRVGPVSDETIRSYIRYWKGISFIKEGEA